MVRRADDARDADGLTVFDWSQAQALARASFSRKAKELAGEVATDDGPYTVAKALEDYFHERERRGSKGVARDRAAAAVRIVPQLGDIAPQNVCSMARPMS